MSERTPCRWLEWPSDGGTAECNWWPSPVPWWFFEDTSDMERHNYASTPEHLCYDCPCYEPKEDE